jgi:hypothetical protein
MSKKKSGSGKDDANSFKARGNKAFQIQEFDEAVSLYTSAIGMRTERQVVFSNTPVSVALVFDYCICTAHAHTHAYILTQTHSRMYRHSLTLTHAHGHPFSLSVFLWNQPLTEEDPENHILYSNRSAAHAGNRHWADALKDAEICVQKNPSWAKVCSL